MQTSGVSLFQGIPHLQSSLMGFLLIASAPTFAVTSNSVPTDHVTAQLISEQTHIIPGQPATIALQIIAVPHWHTYWRNPGDAGLPTSIKWTLPLGATMGDIQWPAPQRLPYGPLTNFGYEGEVLLISDFKLPAEYDQPNVTLSAKGKWLVCKDICIPESGDFTLTLPVVLPGTRLESEHNAKAGFALTRSLLPIRKSDWRIHAEPTNTGAKITLHVPDDIGELAAASYFPYEEGSIEPSKPQPFRSMSHNVYELEVQSADQTNPTLANLKGVLVTKGMDMDDKVQVVEFETPVLIGNSQNTPSSSLSLVGVAGVASVIFLFLLFIVFVRRRNRRHS